MRKNLISHFYADKYWPIDLISFYCDNDVSDFLKLKEKIINELS